VHAAWNITNYVSMGLLLKGNLVVYHRFFFHFFLGVVDKFYF